MKCTCAVLDAVSSRLAHRHTPWGAKWKDYVDLYFILSQHYAFQDIMKKGRKFLQENLMNGFSEQLGYFKDMNYAEQVDYMPGLR